MAYRLLIVPGDNDTLRSLETQLGTDIDVQVVHTANDALWEVRNTPPDLILADVDLPGMSGLDLAELLPNFGVTTKMILWNRGGDSTVAQQAASHGVHHVLSGALDVQRLRQAVYELIAPSPTVADTSASSAPAQPRVAPAPAKPPMSTEQPLQQEPPRAERNRPRPAQERPRPEPEPARPEPPKQEPLLPPRRSRGSRRGPLVLTNDNLPPIRNRLSELQQEVGSQCIVLADRAGMPLTEIGSVAGVPTMVLLPLLSTNFSTANQISSILREGDASALYMQEGTHYDLYCFDVAQRFMLVLIFEKASSATKIGTVWVYAKRAIRDMQEMLA